MTTLQNLIDACEADLADSGNATFAAADIEQWCRDAIADYSMHFPRIVSTTIDCADDDREYDLPADMLSVISVEYPDGEDPKKFLSQRSYMHPDFWSENGYYDVVARADATDQPELWISTKPSDGEDIIVEYQATHDNTILAAGTLTIPAEHLHLLRNYVLWRAAVQLKATEEASPTSNSSLLMSQLAINVDRARRAYVDALAKLVYVSSKSHIISWHGQTDESSRIY